MTPKLVDPTVRRALHTDAADVAAYLVREFAADPASGGDPSVWTPDYTASVIAHSDCWVALNPGVVGFLRGINNCQRVLLGVPVSCNHFDILVADTRIISKALTLFAANDLQAAGTMREMIWIKGPVLSRGGQFARLLRCSEDTTDPERPDWYLPFSLIWARVAAVTNA